MSINYSAVIDEMFTTVKSIVDGSSDLIGYVPEVRWQGVPKSTKPPVDKFWLRASKMIVTEQQASLSSVDDTRMWEAIGLMYVQCFCPRNLASSIDNGRLFAERMRNAFRQQSLSGEIWYRNQKVVELPETAESYPINVVIEFHFKTLTGKSFAGTLPESGNVMEFTISPSTPDGTNRIFDLSPVPSTLMWFWNGELQKQGAGKDYQLVGNQVTMAIAPGINDNLQAFGS